MTDTVSGVVGDAVRVVRHETTLLVRNVEAPIERIARDGLHVSTHVRRAIEDVGQGWEDAKRAVEDGKHMLSDVGKGLSHPYDIPQVRKDIRRALDDGKRVIEDGKHVVGDAKDAVNDVKATVQDVKDIIHDVEDAVSVSRIRREVDNFFAHVKDDRHKIEEPIREVISDAKHVGADIQHGIRDVRNTLADGGRVFDDAHHLLADVGRGLSKPWDVAGVRADIQQAVADAKQLFQDLRRTGSDARKVIGDGAGTVADTKKTLEAMRHVFRRLSSAAGPTANPTSAAPKQEGLSAANADLRILAQSPWPASLFNGQRPEIRVIRNMTDLAASGLTECDVTRRLPIRHINFKTQMLVIAGDVAPSSGYHLQITRVRVQGRGVSVEWDLTPPRSEALTSQVVTPLTQIALVELESVGRRS